MTRYLIRNIPAVFNHLGRDYPAYVQLTLVCSRGYRWDGGEFATREEAIAEGERRTR